MNYERTYICPFFGNEYSDSLKCEGGTRIRFPNKQIMSDYCRDYCCSINGWGRCTIAQMRTATYEKREKHLRELRKKPPNDKQRKA